MIVPKICVFGDGMSEFFTCVKGKTANQFRFQAVEIALHRGIVIWASGTTHALPDAMLSAIKNKTKRCKLAPLVGVQNEIFRLDLLRF